MCVAHCVPGCLRPLPAVFQEELCSDSVERIVVNPNAAYDKFKDKRVGTRGLGQSVSNGQ